RLDFDLVEPAAVHVVNESSHDRRRRDQWGGKQETHIFADALVQIPKRKKVDLAGIDAEVFLHLPAKIAIREHETAALRMMDYRDLIGAEKPLRDDQRAECVLGSAPGVPDDMCV